MDKQICKSCGVEKCFDEFFNSAIKKNGKESKCKDCRKLKNKGYRQEKSEELKEKAKIRYINNRELYLANKAVYYDKNRESILLAKSEYRLRNLETIKNRILDWRVKNASSLKEKAKESRKAVLYAVVDLLGPKCVGCGETVREFLTVDHVNDDGNSERRFGSLGWKRKILSGESDKSRYQVLCHNCNNSKYRKNPVHHFMKKEPTSQKRVCISCGVLKDTSEFRSQSSNSSSICLLCARLRSMKLRFECIDKMGGHCRCCGEKDPYKLTVDHVNDDGSSRRFSGERSGVDIYRKIVSGEVKNQDFQLLCWNCNHSKWRNGGFCYHETVGRSLLNGPLKHTKRHIQKAIGDDQIEFDFNLVIIRHGKLGPDVRKFLDNHHYAGFGRASSDVYTALLDKELIGVAKFAPPVRQGIAASLGVNNNQVIELDRFCIHPLFHKKNFASYFMGKVIKLADEDHPEIIKMVSFADPRFGHVGVIYKATNWKEVGLTSRSYYYVDSEEHEINKKTLYEYAKTRGMSERQCAEALGYRRVHTPPKIKFVYDLKR